jgi:oxidoreductase
VRSITVQNNEVYIIINNVFILGAKANAWTLYPSTKGKAEEAVKELEFERTSIYRPGLLITEREESRILEKTAQCMAGFLDRY